MAKSIEVPSISFTVCCILPVLETVLTFLLLVVHHSLSFDILQLADYCTETLVLEFGFHNPLSPGLENVCLWC